MLTVETKILKNMHFASNSYFIHKNESKTKKICKYFLKKCKINFVESGIASFQLEVPVHVH